MIWLKYILTTVVKVVPVILNMLMLYVSLDLALRSIKEPQYGYAAIAFAIVFLALDFSRFEIHISTKES